jgi:hypothetical protein
MRKRKDYTGQKAGRLTFLKPTEDKNQRTIIWELHCDCGNLVYARPIDVLRGQTHSCGCLATELRQNRKKYTPIIASARDVWRVYKKDGITFEEFFELSQQPCYYCNSKPSNKHNVGLSSLRRGFNINPLQITDGYFIYNGLDRIDSSKLHTIDNVVTCCYKCNWMKSDLSLSDFVQHINRIHAHLELQNDGGTNQAGRDPCPDLAQN